MRLKTSRHRTCAITTRWVRSPVNNRLQLVRSLHSVAMSGKSPVLSQTIVYSDEQTKNQIHIITLISVK